MPFPPAVPADLSTTTALVGAGAARDAGGPAATDLIDEISRAFVIEGKWRNWVQDEIQPRGRLRFEVAMEELASLADPELRVLSVLNELRPGSLHRALARAAAGGTKLVTVNFDVLMEIALDQLDLDPWTVDLQQTVNIERLDAPGAVVKLHGSKGHFKGGSTLHPSNQSLHATIRAIVEAGGGAGLAPDVEHELLACIDQKTLLVVGYSGLDELDVMPSLAKSHPTRVIWIKHEERLPRSLPLEEIEEQGVRSLLCELRDRGADIDFLIGRTREALKGVGLEIDDGPGKDELESIDTSWRRAIRLWAEDAKRREPTGLAWVAMLLTSLGRVGDAREALFASLPSPLPDAPWNEQWRRQEIAENAYHCNLDFGLVREEARQAQWLAEQRQDHDCVAACHHLIARSLRVGDPHDLDGAEEEWRLARSSLDKIAPAAQDADLELERARLRIARSRYGEAAEFGLRAAEMFRDRGLLRLVSEAKQVAGHALSLDGNARRGIELIREARKDARRGPFPEREIAACLALASSFDDLGETEESNAACQEAIEIAGTTENVGEISQAHAFLGLGLSEVGDFVAATEAFEGAFDSLVPATRYQEALIACGLADSLFHRDRPDEALEVLQKYEGQIKVDPNHRLHAAALRWAIGEEGEDDFLRIADQVSTDLKPVGQLAFALARFHAPGPDVASYIRLCEQLIEQGEQWERLERFRAAHRR